MSDEHAQYIKDELEYILSKFEIEQHDLFSTNGIMRGNVRTGFYEPHLVWSEGWWILSKHNEIKKGDDE